MFHHHFFTLAALLASLVVCHGAYAQYGDQPVTVTDLLNMKELGGVTLSPDGRQVVYSVRSIVAGPGEIGPALDTTAVPDTGDHDDYEYRTHLYMADPLRPAESRQLTQGDLSATDAAWHPDGDRIAFVRTIDGRPQVFVLPLLGGEAYAVTHLESGASAPRWSPDGSRLLVASNLTADQVRRRTSAGPIWPLERAGRPPGDSEGIAPDPTGSVAEIRAWLDRNAAEQRPRVFHRLDLHGELGLEDAPKYRHWFVLDTDSASAEPILITRGHYSFGGADWTADGSQVIVSGNMSTDVHPDRVWDTELYVAAADGSGMRPFFAMEGYSVSSPVVAPDGSAVAFTAQRLDQAGYAQTEIGILPFDDPSKARLVTLDFDRSPSAPKWSGDGWYLYFTAASDGGFPLYRVAAFDVAAAPAADASESGPDLADSLAGNASLLPADSAAAASGFPDPSNESQDTTADYLDMAADSLDGVSDSLDALSEDGRSTTVRSDSGPRVERLTSFDRGIRSFDVGSATLFYVASEVANPYELYASDTPFRTDRRLTSHNAKWLLEKRLSFPEASTLEHDGREIQYWVMKPTFFDSARTYPLLLQIHGGPSAMWGPGEASMWHEFQFFASRGYGIVFSNPRGSGGYGNDFRRANFQDWGAGPAGDVLAVASEAVREPWLDPERQVVTGGSYAGYLTAWIVGHDHRFRAAVAQRGVYDLGTFLGEGNAWRLVPTHFGGYPWNRAEDSTRYADQPVQTRDSLWTDFTDTLPRPADSLDAVVEDYVVVEDTTAAKDTAVAEKAAVAEDTTGAENTADADDMTVAEDTAVADDTAAVEGASIEMAHPVSEILIRNSPLTYVDQIQTPLLIIHGDQDLRTGIIQSEILYKSLKILERPVEYVRYPNSGHELSRSGSPSLRMDRILRIYEFMERFVR